MSKREGAMKLFEREQSLTKLQDLLHEVASGNGHTVLISGEAGIGKTSLVELFLIQDCGSAWQLIGRCETLFTPCPLRPFYDIAAQAQGRLQELLGRDLPLPMLLLDLLEEIRQKKRLTILVFEDIHWADEATLDLLKS